MQYVVDCTLLAMNGTRHTIAYPEYIGMTFKDEKTKESWKRKTLRDMFQDKNDHLEGMSAADFILEYVELPEGVSELPTNWKPDPVDPPTKKVVEQPIPFELIECEEFKSRKPKFKAQ